MNRLQSFADQFHTCVIKAHCILDGTGLFQAEQARFSVSVLSARSHGTDFGESESERGPVAGVLGVFVETGRESDRIREGSAKERLLKPGVFDLIVTR